MSYYWKEYNDVLSELWRDNASYFELDPNHIDSSEYINGVSRALLDNRSVKYVRMDQAKTRLDSNNLVLWSLCQHRGTIDTLEIVGTVFENVEILVNLIRNMFHVKNLIIWNYDDNLDALIPLIGNRIKSLELHNVKFANPFVAHIEITKLESYVMDNIIVENLPILTFR